MKTLHQLNPDYLRLVAKRLEGEEDLDCLRQTAWLLGRHAPGCTELLDVGSAAGYLYHYVKALTGHYHGLDNTPEYVELGRRYFARHGLVNASLWQGDFLDFASDRRFDAVVCLGLFYTFPNYHQPLDRLLSLAKRVVIIRALFAEKTAHRYVPVMPESREYCYYNIYSHGEVTDFALRRGFTACWHNDWYVESQGGVYRTAGQDFPFKFLVLERAPSLGDRAGVPPARPAA